MKYNDYNKMMHLNMFKHANKIEEGLYDQIVYEEDCKDYITFIEYPLEYANIFSTMEKFIKRLDSNIKFKVHKFFTEHISKLSFFKTKTLLPAYVSLYYLACDNIIISTSGCLYLFNIDIKHKKIPEIFKIIDMILETNDKQYEIYDKKQRNTSMLIKGWVYILTIKTPEICKILHKILYDMFLRVYIINILMNVKSIPTHFNIYKEIDNYMYVVMYHLINDNYKSLICKLSNYDTELLLSSLLNIYKYIEKSVIKKSHTKKDKINKLIELSQAIT